jgi:flagellar biosynthetic protein FliP
LRKGWHRCQRKQGCYVQALHSVFSLVLSLRYLFLLTALSSRTGQAAWNNGRFALHDFMIRQTRKADIILFARMANVTTIERPESTPFDVLVPAYVISELKTAFIMGFCIYLPFLLVDLVVSSVLTSMGMVMMPPALISAPFKVLLFVLADGWHLIARAITASFY